MPKANRYFVEGHHYHLTHRCHGQHFLLKYAKDRDVYREMLRQRLAAYNTPLLGYCITSNHVHLLVTATTSTSISQFMDALEGDFAQYYNLRKKRSGAFWDGRYHATAVSHGKHLWNCLLYIDLNMVRAGTVDHPSKWPWCSCNDLFGQRKRYRVIDPVHFERSFGQHPNSVEFKENYAASLMRRLQSGHQGRNAIWTESLAVGNKRFISQIASIITNRRHVDTELYADQDTATWVLKESRPEYA